MSLNKVQLIGNVGGDPEIRYFGDKQKAAQMSLATTERYKDRNNEIKENTEWHKLVAFGKVAEIIEKYVKKGSQIYVEGKLRTRDWVDQAGVKKYITEIVIENLQLLGSKTDPYIAGARQMSQQQQQQQQVSADPAQSLMNTNASIEQTTDDLPF